MVAMVKFAKAYLPPAKIGLYPQAVIWLTASVLTMMAVTQLVDLQSFVEVFANYSLPRSEASPQITASILAITEVFALPFLLRMRLSYLMRWFSLLCGWAAVLLWACLTFYAFEKGLDLSNTGYFGFVPWPMGVFSILFVITLVFLMAFSSQVLKHDFKRKK